MSTNAPAYADSPLSDFDIEGMNDWTAASEDTTSSNLAVSDDATPQAPENVMADAANGDAVRVSFADRREKGGMYDILVEQFLKMGKSALAGISYPDDFSRIYTMGMHYKYVTNAGLDNEDELCVLLFGQIMSRSYGTDLSAKGTYNARMERKLCCTDRTWEQPIGDTTSVKNVIVLGMPSFAMEDVTDLFNDQIGTLNEIRTLDEIEEHNLGQRVIISEWLRSSRTEPGSVLDLITVHTERKYGIPPKAKVSASPGSNRIIKKKRGADDEGSSMGDEVKLGATYDPSVLPDHRGTLFNHVHAQVQQPDFRDMDENLIAPWELQDKL
ncbi:hypothetical protein WOLCODRAFT_21029 [Wolfiporia cocos MD-104 SS10]|uniref:Uncharacterized protein n=1 Tax=Wolfiporia cocos (strain MD-104) TaxID=742152 RepID=A0A2H3J537_WOLCO|nr:hypothetical protein WOLCODRAFT_21029 [Wolfiporia cocos MD-104 SS10]